MARICAGLRKIYSQMTLGHNQLILYLTSAILTSIEFHFYIISPVVTQRSCAYGCTL